MPSFLLIRHAEAPWSPDPMRALSAAGRVAAERLAARLGKLEIEAIYSSPYRRALETVAPLARRLGLAVEEQDDLRERELGSPQGSSFEEAVAATFADLDLSHPGGESSRSAQRRAASLVEALSARHSRGLVALSSHGNWITCLLNHFARTVGFEFWQSLTFPDVYRLDVPSSGAGSFERLE